MSQLKQKEEKEVYLRMCKRSDADVKITYEQDDLNTIGCTDINNIIIKNTIEDKPKNTISPVRCDPHLFVMTPHYCDLPVYFIFLSPAIPLNFTAQFITSV